MLEKFKDISFIFKNNKNDLLENRKNQIEEKINFYIDKDMLNIVMDYRIHGYVLTSKQEKNFFKKYKLVQDKKKVDLLLDNINKEQNIPNSILIELFDSVANTSYFYYNNTSVDFDIPQDNSLQKVLGYYRKSIKNDNLQILLNEDIEKGIKDLIFYKRIGAHIDNYISGVENRSNSLSKKISLWFYLCEDNLSSDEKKKFIVKINKILKIIEDYKGYFQSTYIKLSKSYENSILSDIKEDKQYMNFLYSENNAINELVQKKYLKERTNNNVENLPSFMRDTVEEITKNYIYLRNHLNSFNLEEKHKIQNLWETRIPEILNVYFKSDPVHRTTMKDSQGRTVETITSESLKDISNVFNKFKISLSETALSDASALKRYTKSL